MREQEDDRPEAVGEVSVRLSRTKTWGGLETKSNYGPADSDALDYFGDLGDPGTFPYTRGAYPEMYRSRMWTLRNIVGYGAPEDTRDGIDRAIAAGSAGIDIVLDTLSQEGIDPDHPLFRSEVGMEGCSLASVDDLELLLRGIDVTVTDIAWHSAILVYPMVVALARRQGRDPGRLVGSHMPDHLQLSLTGYGERLMPARVAHRAALDCLEFAATTSPRWACGFPQAYNLRERGLTPSGEIAVGMAIVCRTFDDLESRGTSVDTVAPAMAWVSTSGIDLFEEVAKYRALRRIWARTLRDRYGARDPRSLRLRIACHTSGRALTYQQPHNNLARATVQTLAAILGGAQSVETCTWDEPVGIPTHESRELAIRTQQILAHEVGAARTADPLGGSWYVESLTNDVEREASRLFDEIAEQDLLDAIESGWLEALMDDVNTNMDEEMRNGERFVVGVNAFASGATQAPRRFSFDTSSLPAHLERLAAMKRRRDPGRLRTALRRVHQATVDGENTTPAMIDAFLADATMGEVWGTFREANGYPYDPFETVGAPIEGAAAP